ncbi:DUF3797 domain-containing protein, partial [Escherichia sp. TWPC-MK]
MDAWKTLELMSEYGKCKQCGNEIIGDGEGTLEVEDENGVNEPSRRRLLKGIGALALAGSCP